LLSLPSVRIGWLSHKVKGPQNKRTSEEVLSILRGEGRFGWQETLLTFVWTTRWRESSRTLPITSGRLYQVGLLVEDRCLPSEAPLSFFLLSLQWRYMASIPYCKGDGENFSREGVLIGRPRYSEVLFG